MVQRDYAARGRTTAKKKANKVNKGLLLAIAAAVVAIFAAGLYLLKEKATETNVVVGVEKTEESKPKSTLPSRPEEVWSYIRDLETREIPIDNSPKSLDKVQNLTEEQKKILQMLERDAEEAEVAKNNKNVAVQAQVQVQETVKRTEEVVAAPVAPTATAEKPKAQTTKPAEKPPEVVQAKPKQEAVQPKTTSTAKFGLQCGAFKNREQAENLQARLVMAGFDARVSSSSTFNRIFIGPIGDRAAANATLQKAKGVTECVVIGM